MKHGKRILIELLVLTMLLTALVFVASASTNDSQESASESETSEVSESSLQNMQIPDFGPHVFDKLKENTDFLAAKGKMPQYTTQEERQNWLHKLDQSRLIVRNDIEPYVYPKGPVICYGWNIDGYFNVVLYEGINVTDSQINEMYNVINKDANKASIQEIPVVFKKRDFFKNAASGYDTRYRNPVIGAIQLACNGDFATLSFAAKKSDGTKGYVTVQHIVQNIGDQMYQPTTASENELGTVSIISDHYADACFVPYSDVAAKIHVGSGNTLPVKSYVASVPSDSLRGTHVYKSGRITGVTDGYITGVEDLYLGMQYYDMLNTSVHCEGGDSGAPLYTKPTSSECRLYGICKSSSSTYSHFSSLYGVKHDLGVTPITA